MSVSVMWLILAGIFFVLEIITTGFLVFWCGIGALIAMGLSFIPSLELYIQVIAFTVSSVLLIFCTRKFAKKVQPADVPTNVYTILGKKATVSQTINNQASQGQIKIDGDIWSAKAENDEEIKEGSTVEVLNIDGVKAVVKQIN